MVEFEVLGDFDYQYKQINGVLFLFFNCIHDGCGEHIGGKILDTFDNLTMADDKEKIFVDGYPFDLFARNKLILFKLT